MRAQGGDALKFLIQIRADRPAGDGPDLAAEGVEVIRQVVEDCRTAGVPSVIENLIYPLPGEELTPQARENAIIEAAVALDSLRPDLLKLEYPGSPEGCRRLAEAISSPWAVLSAGVAFDEFTHVLQVSCDEGGASGFIAGRAVWKETVGMSRPERRAYLADEGRRRLEAAWRRSTDGRCPGAGPRRGEDMTAPVLEARGLTRQFGHVTALDNLDFDVYAGEVVALIGDNGAGKSTLVKALSGNLAVDQGEVFFDGAPTDIPTPTAASALGIETVHQDLALAPHLDPVQNMFLGRETMRGGLLGRLGFMDTPAMRGEAQSAFDKLGATVRSLTTPVGAMSGGQRQAIAIARAVHWANRVVFLDEPTAALGVRQTANVLDTIRRVRDHGVAVVFISHSMPHVMDVSDRVQVLRMGRRVATYQTSETNMEQLVGAMTGAMGDAA